MVIIAACGDLWTWPLNSVIVSCPLCVCCELRDSINLLRYYVAVHDCRPSLASLILSCNCNWRICSAPPAGENTNRKWEPISFLLPHPLLFPPLPSPSLLFHSCPYVYISVPFLLNVLFIFPYPLAYSVAAYCGVSLGSIPNFPREPGLAEPMHLPNTFWCMLTDTAGWRFVP